MMMNLTSMMMTFLLMKNNFLHPFWQERMMVGLKFYGLLTIAFFFIVIFATWREKRERRKNDRND
jgi:hypothetical protein